MDAVQAEVTKEQLRIREAAESEVPLSGKAPVASARTEAIVSFLMQCDRGGKQLIAAFPALGPRKGGSG